jgi:hypothetical protein
VTLGRRQDLCVDAADAVTVAAFWAPVLSLEPSFWGDHGDRDDVPSLVEHGATVLREPDDDVHWHVLADPAGNEFCVMAP